MTDTKRSHYDNLLYVCRNCHRMIDQQPNEWPVERLMEIKCQHVAWVQRQELEAISRITYNEIEQTVQHLARTWTDSVGRMGKVDIEAKIQRNGLGADSRALLNLGTARADLVMRYLQAQVPVDADFPERLRCDIADLYNATMQGGRSGDSLVDELRYRLAGPNADQARRAAALALLAYFFSTCDVFEAP